MKDIIKHDNAGVVLYRGGETIKGTVLDANSHRILLHLPGGVTGIITKKEATGYGAGSEDFEPGVPLEAMVIDPENDQGLVVLSLRRASQDMVWAELNQIQEEKRIIKVKIEEANKGGLMSRYKGLKAFLPVSQLMPVNYPRVDGADSAEILSKLQEHIGKEFSVCVINVDREEEKVILSEKEAYREQSQNTLQELKVGDVISGEVSGIVKFGIFVTFGGVEGLVHLSEIDWGHVSNPGEKFKLNDKVDVLVIGIDGDKLSFSIKRLEEDPWIELVKKYTEGQSVSGKVLRWNAQGVFIEIEPEIQGFFELEQFEVESHSDLSLQAGETMEGEIKQINTDSHRIELVVTKDQKKSPSKETVSKKTTKKKASSEEDTAQEDAEA